MNKKIISLLLILFLLISITVTYAIYSQSTSEDELPSDSSETISDNTLTTEIDSTFLDENQGVEIGEMI
ncbi:MAG: hypothetical protein V1726_00945 [Methanobacteriota archaeon]